jgi:hypothetical protein
MAVPSSGIKREPYLRRDQCSQTFTGRAHSQDLAAGLGRSGLPGTCSGRQNTVSEHGPARPILDGAKHRNSAGAQRCPESISRDAEVMVLGRHGYEIAVKGKNGFVCIVQRSWTAGIVVVSVSQY